MEKWLLAAFLGQGEQEQKIIEKQLEAPCFDWDFGRGERFEIRFSTLFFYGKKQLYSHILEQEWENTDVIVLSDDGECLMEAKNQGIATIGYQPEGSGEFLEGTDLVVEELEDLDARLLYRQIQREAGIPWTILETERLVVREFQMSDLDELFLLYEGEGMTDYIEPLYPYEEEREYQREYIRHMYRYFGYGMWLVFEKRSGQLVGRAGIENRPGWDGELELGYAIGTPFQRKGYGTEVCRAILDYGRDCLGAKQLYCLVEPENEASIALAKKIGFVFEKECFEGEKRMCIMRCIL